MLAWKHIPAWATMSAAYMALSDRDKLFYLSMWAKADRNGRGLGGETPMRMTFAILGGDPAVDSLARLGADGLATLYMDDGESYWELTSYLKDAPRDVRRKSAHSVIPAPTDAGCAEYAEFAAERGKITHVAAKPAKCRSVRQNDAERKPLQGNGCGKMPQDAATCGKTRKTTSEIETETEIESPPDSSCAQAGTNIYGAPQAEPPDRTLTRPHEPDSDGEYEAPSIGDPYYVSPEDQAAEDAAFTAARLKIVAEHKAEKKARLLDLMGSIGSNAHLGGL